MAAKSKLPPNLEPALLAKAGEGLSTRQIAAWMLSEHGIAINATSIQRYLKKVRVERSEITQAVVREKLGTEVVTDIDVLTREQDRVAKLSERLHGHAHQALDILDKAAIGDDVGQEAKRTAILASGEFSELALKASDRVKGITDRKLHYAGAGKDEDGSAELAEAGDRIRSRLAALADAAREGSGDPGHRPDES